MDLISLFSNYSFRIVAIGTALIGMISAVVGSYSVIRREALIGDALSHCSLAGITLVFIIFGSKEIEMLLLGAALAGIVGVFFIKVVSKNSKISFDTALAVVLSSMFGLGVVFLNYIQKNAGSHQAGLERFIYGQASTLLMRDIRLMIFVGILLLLLILIFWKEFKIICFDYEFAKSMDLPVEKLTIIMSLMTVLAVIIGLQSVGVILMVSLLIAPGVVARQWTDKLSVMMIIGGIVGSVSGLLGTLISMKVKNMPTGPMIIAILSAFVLFSLVFAPNRGMIAIRHRNKKSKQKLLLVNQEEVDLSIKDELSEEKAKNYYKRRKAKQLSERVVSSLEKNNENGGVK